MRQSIEPSRSSTVAIAHMSPFLVVLRCRVVISPAIVTISPSLTAPSSASELMEVEEFWAMTCSSPYRGWSETYRPSMLRSKASSSLRSHSGRSGMVSVAAEPEAIASSPSPPPAPPKTSAKRSYWPWASLRLTSTTESTASSWISTRERRLWPRESKAPPLISDSMVRLLHTDSGTLSRKSVKEVKAPFSSRVRMISSTTFAPTLRIAERPKRMSSPTAEKYRSDSLTSGGSTVMPRWRQSPR